LLLASVRAVVQDARVTAHLWRILLTEARELVDEQIERGRRPVAEHVVQCVLAAHPFLRDADNWRRQLHEEVENYLEAEVAA
jgi:hypothetical protein